MKQVRLFLKIVLFLGVGFFLELPSLACSSCGSGGDDPLILFPNESKKAFQSIGYQGGFKDYSSDGTLTKARTIESRIRGYSSLGLRLGSHSFVTLGLPYFQNSNEHQSLRVLGDPTINTRLTLHRQTIVRPHIPQVQLLLGAKKSLSKGSHESDHPSLLDIGGTGFDDIRLGGDLWWAMTSMVFGISYSETHSQSEKIEGNTHGIGVGRTYNITTGYSRGKIKAICGLVKLTRGRRVFYGESISDSDLAQNNAFATFEYKISDATSLRQTLVQSGVYKNNKNSSQSTTLTSAWMTTW